MTVLSEEKIFTNLKIILFSFLPISFLLGEFAINLNVISIGIFFIVFLKKKFYKNYINIDKNLFFLLLLFSLYLLLHFIFSNNFGKGGISSAAYVRCIILSLSFLIFFNDNNLFENKILKFWNIIFLILTLDLLYEFINGYNILNFKNNEPGRLSSFMRHELRIGDLYLILSFMFLSTVNVSKHRKTLIFIIPIICFMVLVIGQRASFLKLIISLILVFIFLNLTKIKKLFIIIFTFFIISLSIFFLKDYTYRYYQYLIQPILSTNIYTYFQNSHHGAHYNTAYKIFLNHPIVGIGVKNFYKESIKEKYFNPNYRMTNMRASTHPHNIWLQLLSETGIIGFLIFFSLTFYLLLKSIKRYSKNKNAYILFSSSLFFSLIFPILPSGSFFSTFNGNILWLSIGLCALFLYKKNDKF